jgi:curved DNA-binding protein CbpA
MRISDCFALFSLPHTASKDDVKKQYRHLVKKYHPDSPRNTSSREKFEQVQQAYELIKAFFEFRETYTFEDVPVNDERLERIKRARELIKQKRERERKKILGAIKQYRQSYWFVVSRFFVFLSIILASLILVDNLLPTTITYEYIQEIEYLNQREAQIVVASREVPVSSRDAFLLEYTDYVLLETSALFHQIEDIYYYVEEHDKHQINFFSLYNDGYFFLCILLLFSTKIFYMKRTTFQYYIMIRFYNTIVLPILCVYILFGDKRIFGLLGLF